MSSLIFRHNSPPACIHSLETSAVAKGYGGTGEGRKEIHFLVCDYQRFRNAEDAEKQKVACPKGRANEHQ